MNNDDLKPAILKCPGGWVFPGRGVVRAHQKSSAPWSYEGEFYLIAGLHPGLMNAVGRARFEGTLINDVGEECPEEIEIEITERPEAGSCRFRSVSRGAQS